MPEKTSPTPARKPLKSRKSFLSEHSRVLDFGANYGHFLRPLVERFGCECAAFEPAPTPFDAIPSNERIRKFPWAVSDNDGTADLHLAGQSTSSSIVSSHETFTNTIQVPTRTLATILSELNWQDVDLLKIDIEGAELPLLNGTPQEVLQRVAQISVEFHDFNGLTPEPAIKECLSRLASFGFEWVRFSRRDWQDVWLVNRQMCDISWWEIKYIRYGERNWRGAKRLLSRRLGLRRRRSPKR